MKKVIVVFLMVVLILIMGTACGSKEGEVTSSQSVDSKSNGVQNSKNADTESKKVINNAKNIDKLEKLIRDSMDRTGYASSPDYATLISDLTLTYKNSIISPITGATTLDLNNKTIDYMYTTKDRDYIGYSGAIITLFDLPEPKLAQLEKGKVNLACIPVNNGVVVGLIAKDGYYIYEIGPDGNKINEKEYCTGWTLK